MSGYAHHTRAFVREFVRRGVSVQVEHLGGWPDEPLPEGDDPWFEGLRSPVGARLLLHFAMPFQVVPAPDVVNVNFTMFEAATLPGRWVEAAAAVDHIVLPTASSRDAWVASGVAPEKIHLCPLGVDPERFDGTAGPLDLELPDGRRVGDFGVRFLNVAEARPRKNQAGLLRSWIRATRPDDDAVLVMRLGATGRWDHLGFFLDLANALKEAGLRQEEGAPVLFLTEPVAGADMPSLYAAATHYVSMSCGEGWDLPMMEAASSGLSLVAPAHSAYLEYLHDDIVEWIPAPEAPATFTGTLRMKDEWVFEGLRWWPPDEDEAVRVIRRIVEGHPGRRPGPGFAAEHSWTRATDRLLSILDGLERRGGSGPRQPPESPGRLTT